MLRNGRPQNDAAPVFRLRTGTCACGPAWVGRDAIRPDKSGRTQMPPGRPDNGGAGSAGRRGDRTSEPAESSAASTVKSIEKTGGRPTRRDRQTRREGLRDKGIARPSEPSKPPGASDLQGQRTRKRMPPSSNAGLPQTGRTSPSNAS